MSISAIIIIIILGIILFIVEFLLIPGVTIAGIGGFILLATGIYFAYHTHGFATGNIVLLSTAVASIFAVYFSLRSRTWKGVMLDSNIDGKSFTDAEEKVKIGDQGECITRMNPMGKVLINGEILEGKTKGEFLDENTKVEIVKIIGPRIIVKPIK